MLHRLRSGASRVGSFEKYYWNYYVFFVKYCVIIILQIKIKQFVSPLCRRRLFEHLIYLGVGRSKIPKLGIGRYWWYLKY
jgi:hypothetical protein